VSSAAWRYTKRGLALAVTGVSLYLVAPSLLTLFDAWPELGHVRPWWFAVVVILESCSFVSLWLLLRIALQTRTWFDIASSQLASNAASRIIPGGAASGTVIQASMLVGAGYRPAVVGSALGAAGLLTTGMLMALPVLTLPALATGLRLAHQLQLGLIVSLILAVALVGVGFAVLTWDRVMHVVARVAGVIVARVLRKGDARETAARVVVERDRVAAAFDGRWLRALASAAGNRMLDYATLVAAMVAVGAHLRPSVVLVAYVGGMALALVPLTPGGLGFVETGLTGLLVLAGADPEQAVAGTLLYRLASYWLPIPLGGVAWASWRVRQARHARAARSLTR
jgi:hypothetical protein